MDLVRSVFAGVRSVLGKHSSDDEDGFDGHPQKRRRVLNSSQSATGSQSPRHSKQSPMPRGFGDFRYFDKDSDRYFQNLVGDSPPRSANPIPDVPASDDEIQEVQNPLAATRLASTSPASQRITRSTQLARGSAKLLEEESRLLGPSNGVSGLSRRRGPDTGAVKVPEPTNDNMSSRKPFVAKDPYKPIDSLNNTRTSRSDYLAGHTTRTTFGRGSPKIVAPQASQQNGKGKGHIYQTRADDASSPNPPYKKPRIGPSPKRGPSDHDAISLDDSQDPVVLPDDDVKHTPDSRRQIGEAAGRSSQNIFINGTGTTHAHTPTKERSSEQTAHAPRRSHALPKFGRHLHAHSTRNSVIQNVDDDGDDGVEFVKEASRQRKALDHHPPHNFGAGLTKHLSSHYFASRNMDSTTPSTDDRQKPPTSTTSTRVQGSQSPDLLQEGTTVGNSTLANVKSSGQQPRRPCEQPKSALKELIVGKDNSTQVPRGRRSKQKDKLPEARRFELKHVRWYFSDHLGDLASKLLCFVIDLTQDSFYFDMKRSVLGGSGEDAVEAVTSAHSLRRIYRVKHGATNGFLSLDLSNKEGQPEGPIDLELMSHKQVIDFISSLQEIDDNLGISPLTDEKMEQVVDYHRRNLFYTRSSEATGHVRAPMRTRPTQSPAYPIKTMQEPQHMIDKPDAARSMPASKDRGTLFGRNSIESSEDAESATQTTISRPQNQTELHSNHFTQPTTRIRSLRSSAPSAKQKEKSSEPARPKFSSTGGLGTPWKHSLVYPKEGKKRESIGFDELWRLDDDEFLNDTLIGFFSRYIQHRTEVERPQVMKKVHFFNSYFFDSLNKGTKGVKHINYESVARWTAKVDLFSRDFVVVPVNENLHWYLAIICNLPYLKPTSEETEVDNDRPETPSTSNGREIEDANKDPRTNDTQRSFQELSIQDRNDVSSPKTLTSQGNGSSPVKRGLGGRKAKPRRSLPKYDTDKPIIITLDSLGSARGSTCAALKQYIVREAKDKRGWDISDQEIKGMTAKGIPTQGNWSDCGLYMCMYLEQFILHPHRFVAKLLQREESQIRWPKQIQSDNLRERMRGLLLDLYRLQEGEQKPDEVKIPEIGEILVNMREASPEPEVQVATDSPRLPPRLTASEQIKAQKRRFSQHFEQKRESTSQDAITVDASDHDDEGFQPNESVEQISASSQNRLAAEALQQVDAPIVIKDDEKRSPAKKKRRVGSPGWTHDGPGDLAQRMREMRSSAESKNTATNANIAVAEAALGITRRRSESVSTDFLTENTRFAEIDGVNATTNDKANTKERTVLGEIELGPWPADVNAAVHTHVQSHAIDNDKPLAEAAAAEDSSSGSVSSLSSSVVAVEDLRAEVSETQVPDSQEKQHSNATPSKWHAPQVPRQRIRSPRIKDAAGDVNGNGDGSEQMLV